MKAISQAEKSIRPDFSFRREFPSELRKLEKISSNYFWSWQPEGAALFRDLDSTLWDRVEQNPRSFLAKVRDLRLWQAAGDSEFLVRLDRFYQKQIRYLAEPPSAHGDITLDNPVAYFCAEFGIHHSLAIYSGGLGILAGDHLKSASDLNIPLIGIGLLYRYGYFRQHISHDGWQKESYDDIFDRHQALSPVLDDEGNRVEVSIHMRGREVFAQAWLARIGRISLYLLDTNVEHNQEVDRLVTGHLYGGDTETRIVQEKILGIGGVRLLRKLKISPSVFHLNEGHSAFLSLELAREFLEANKTATFENAISHVRQQCVFTTHTPVSAGNDSFSPELIDACFDKEFVSALRLTHDELFALGRSDVEDGLEWFGMTPLALRMSRSANGVSEIHGDVSRKLWKSMFPTLPNTDQIPITYVTNGVHPSTWIAPLFQNLFREKIGADWREISRDQTVWQEKLAGLSDAEIWKAHQILKNKLIAFVRRRTHAKKIGELEIISEHLNTSTFFDGDVLTIGFARRIAAYKRWNLLLTDIDRLISILDDEKRPVQLVFAGKAHPHDKGAKSLLQTLISQNHRAAWIQRAVFLEDYDQEIARYMVQGVDVWLNVPRRPLEASGTSGQKAAMNGVLNFSILDGWWPEGFDGKNGFAIGVASDSETDEDLIDAADAASFYEVLENAIVPAYYERNSDGLPASWIAKMRRSLATLLPKFSSDRMLNDYLTKIYSKGELPR